MEKILNRKHVLFLVGMTMIIVSIATQFNHYHTEKETTQAANNFINNGSIPINSNNNEQFIMVLEIPKISLKKGLYNISSQYNDVDQNIQIIKDSKLSSDDISSLILVGHSGNSKIAYFNDLHKLSLKDNIYIYYNRHKYIYELTTIYDIPKTGYFYPENSSQHIITLITCKNNSKDLQAVYVGKLIKKLRVSKTDT